jgi:hypothetical protein
MVKYTEPNQKNQLSSPSNEHVASLIFKLPNEAWYRRLGIFACLDCDGLAAPAGSAHSSVRRARNMCI